MTPSEAQLWADRQNISVGKLLVLAAPVGMPVHLVRHLV